MRQRHPAPLIATLFVAACATTKPAATTLAPQVIPASLVSALIDGRIELTSSSREYAVGTIPRGYPTRLVPSGPVRIVGGMATRNESIAIFADSTRRLGTVFEQLFEQAGFARPVQASGHGFSAPVGPSSYFCGDSTTVSVEPLGGANRDLVRVTVHHRLDPFACEPPKATAPQHELALPALTPPPGARVGRSSGGGGTAIVSSSAEMTGADLAASAIVAHYAAQLVAAGWTADTPAISPRAAVQYFQAKDSSGAVWGGVLVASGGPARLSLALTMNPLESR